MPTILAPAKLNLTLEVLAKRRDGYHEIRSVMQTISLCDRLSFEPAQHIEFRSDSPEWLPEKSLVSRAARLLQETTECTKGAIITVGKRIPLVAGLGGDSSDAAATLCGLDQLWRLSLPRQELHRLAVQLGSDVAFFLYGGTALVEGRGEMVTPLPPFPHMWVVLAVPPVPRLPEKTKQLYNSLTANHYTDGRITRELVEQLRAGKELTPSVLFNTFENVAFARHSELRVSRSHMAKIGSTEVHLAGSGPALFALFKDKVKAEELCQRLKHQKYEPYLAETSAAVNQAQ